MQTKTIDVVRYIIFFDGQPPFYTKYFDAENTFQPGMTVVDVLSDLYTTDGVTWLKMQVDHL